MEKTKRKYRRWVGINLSFDLHALVDIARKQGMLCITASKPPMFFFNHIGLYGTPEMMRNTEKEWGKGEDMEIRNREPDGCLTIRLDKPQSEWVDK